MQGCKSNGLLLFLYVSRSATLFPLKLEESKFHVRTEPALSDLAESVKGLKIGRGLSLQEASAEIGACADGGRLIERISSLVVQTSPDCNPTRGAQVLGQAI